MDGAAAAGTIPAIRAGVDASGSRSKQEYRRCPEAKVQIKPEACATHVFDIVFDPLLKILTRRSRTADLPKPGDARANAEA